MHARYRRVRSLLSDHRLSENPPDNRHTPPHARVLQAPNTAAHPDRSMQAPCRGGRKSIRARPAGARELVDWYRRVNVTPRRARSANPPTEARREMQLPEMPQKKDT